MMTKNVTKAEKSRRERHRQRPATHSSSHGMGFLCHGVGF